MNYFRVNGNTCKHFGSKTIQDKKASLEIFQPTAYVRVVRYLDVCLYGAVLFVTYRPCNIFLFPQSPLYQNLLNSLPVCCIGLSVRALHHSVSALAVFLSPSPSLPTSLSPLPSLFSLSSLSLPPSHYSPSLSLPSLLPSFSLPSLSLYNSLHASLSLTPSLPSLLPFSLSISLCLSPSLSISPSLSLSFSPSSLPLSLSLPSLSPSLPLFLLSLPLPHLSSYISPSLCLSPSFSTPLSPSLSLSLPLSLSLISSLSFPVPLSLPPSLPPSLHPPSSSKHFLCEIILYRSCVVSRLDTPGLSIGLPVVYSIYVIRLLTWVRYGLRPTYRATVLFWANFVTCSKLCY